MSHAIIVTEDVFSVRPGDIDASKHFYEAFDNTETEISARWIIRFLQERNEGWRPFTYDEINVFYGREFSHDFEFNRLVKRGWIILRSDGKYYITADFICRCYRASPVQEKQS